MALRALAAALASGLAVGGGLLVTGCATSSASRTDTTSSRSATGGSGSATAKMAVSPVMGKPTTAFTFAFTAPHATGRQGGTQLGYQLSVLGPVRTGCLAARTAAVPVASAGQPVTLTLDPVKLGGVWCRGGYTARVSEVQTPVCSAGEMCPQYIRVVAIIARGTFTVR
jgi:hypothetical protein